MSLIVACFVRYVTLGNSFLVLGQVKLEVTCFNFRKDE